MVYENRVVEGIPAKERDRKYFVVKNPQPIPYRRLSAEPISLHMIPSGGSSKVGKDPIY